MSEIGSLQALHDNRHAEMVAELDRVRARRASSAVGGVCGRLFSVGGTGRVERIRVFDHHLMAIVFSPAGCAEARITGEPVLIIGPVKSVMYFPDGDTLESGIGHIPDP